jgi:hypothetical protein
VLAGFDCLEIIHFVATFDEDKSVKKSNDEDAIRYCIGCRPTFGRGMPPYAYKPAKANACNHYPAGNQTDKPLQ